MIALYGLLAAMWALILSGGAVAVVVLGPFATSGYGELDHILTSAAKVAVAVLMIVTWVFVLTKVKNRIIHKMFHSQK